MNFSKVFDDCDIRLSFKSQIFVTVSSLEASFFRCCLKTILCEAKEVLVLSLIASCRLLPLPDTVSLSGISFSCHIFLLFLVAWPKNPLYSPKPVRTNPPIFFYIIICVIIYGLSVLSQVRI